MKTIPVYKLRTSVDESGNDEVNYIALVADPAIENNWIAFNAIKRFSADKERRLIMGVAMIANMPIYRRDAERGEHYVVFDRQEVERIVYRFFKKGYNYHFNIEHDPLRAAPNVYVVGSLLVDERMGVDAPTAFKGVSEGSWIITVKVDDDKVWDEFVKTGEVKGFSVEGLFTYEAHVDSDEAVLKEIAEIVNSI